MSTKYTPLFAKDGDQYVVPSQKLVYDTPEEAVAGGAAAGLVLGYGLVATGETAEVADEGGYAGPFVIASVGNIVAWIVGGPTLDSLTADRHPAVENLTDAPKVTPGNDDGADLGALASAIIDAAATQALEPTPEFGGSGGTDGAGAGGSF